jgi:hypothetical protein
VFSLSLQTLSHTHTHTHTHTQTHTHTHSNIHTFCVSDILLSPTIAIKLHAWMLAMHTLDMEHYQVFILEGKLSKRHSVFKRKGQCWKQLATKQSQCEIERLLKKKSKAPVTFTVADFIFIVLAVLSVEQREGQFMLENMVAECLLWSRGRAILHYRVLAVLAVEQRED